MMLIGLMLGKNPGSRERVRGSRIEVKGKRHKVQGSRSKEEKYKIEALYARKNLKKHILYRLTKCPLVELIEGLFLLFRCQGEEKD